MFSTLTKTEIIIYVTFLSHANAFNLDKVKFLWSGYGLKPALLLASEGLHFSYMKAVDTEYPISFYPLTHLHMTVQMFFNLTFGIARKVEINAYH